jgi:hypothetical protein
MKLPQVISLNFKNHVAHIVVDGAEVKEAQYHKKYPLTHH